MAVDQLNTYDVLASDDVVFTRAPTTSSWPATARAAPRPTAKVADAPAATEEPAAKAESKTEAKTEAKAEPKAEAVTEADDDKPALPKGAKAPLKSAQAPKGYEVMADEADQVYREPEDEGYDVTAADFWFKSAEDAEAAGFTKEGDK